MHSRGDFLKSLPAFGVLADLSSSHPLHIMLYISPLLWDIYKWLLLLLSSNIDFPVDILVLLFGGICFHIRE